MGRRLSFCVDLEPDDRAELERLRRKTTLPVGMHKRVTAILLLADRWSEQETARRAGLGVRIVRKWGRRFEDHGLAGLNDKPGRGRKPVFSP